MAALLAETPTARREGLQDLEQALRESGASGTVLEEALALIVENAGWGAGVAAPMARRVFDYVLLGLYPNDDDLAADEELTEIDPDADAEAAPASDEEI